MKICIIGIYDRIPDFSPEQRKVIEETHAFAGGERHSELVKNFLPKNRKWVSITAPLSALIEEIRQEEQDWVIFASGDPLFFGIGNTLKREFPEVVLNIFPAFNSLQLLAHRFKINYGEFKTVTLTGRNWHEFDKALMQGEPRIAILTDKKNTPPIIASRMLEFGYDNYTMYYGERMGGNREKIAHISLQEATDFSVNHPNCFFLEMSEFRLPRKGIPESEFEILDGRPNMITKMAVRLATLAALELHTKNQLWDIGTCTGSISIEARLHFPHLKVTAFEKREESRELVKKNAQRFQAPGIQLFIGDYLDTEKKGFEQPDAVFLGGYGGEMNILLDDVNNRLASKGMIVFNSVSEKSLSTFLDWAETNHYRIRTPQKLTVDSHNPITILSIEKP